MTILIIITILVLLSLVVIAMYNTMKKGHLKVMESQSNINVYIGQRYDGISAMYKMAEEFRLHEAKLMKDLVRLRSMAANTSNFDERMKINGELDTKLPQMMAQLEEYPELNSSKLYMKLQEEIQNNEENISAAKKSYNGYVNIYNTSIKLFPNVLFSRAFGFETEKLIERQKEKEKHPLL